MCCPNASCVGPIEDPRLPGKCPFQYVSMKVMLNMTMSQYLRPKRSTLRGWRAGCGLIKRSSSDIRRISKRPEVITANISATSFFCFIFVATDKNEEGSLFLPPSIHRNTRCPIASCVGPIEDLNHNPIQHICNKASISHRNLVGHQ